MDFHRIADGCGLILVGKLLCEVGPCGIRALDEPDLFLAAPALDFLLAGDGGVDEGEFLKVDKTEDSVTRGESANEGLAMLGHAAFEAASYAGVKVARPASEDVDAVGAGHLG